MKYAAVGLKRPGATSLYHTCDGGKKKQERTNAVHLILS